MFNLSSKFHQKDEIWIMKVCAMAFQRRKISSNDFINVYYFDESIWLTVHFKSRLFTFFYVRTGQMIFFSNLKAYLLEKHNNRNLIAISSPTHVDVETVEIMERVQNAKTGW